MNLNEEDILTLCSYEAYKNGYSKYRNVRDRLEDTEITTLEEANLILEALKDTHKEDVKDQYFNPIRNLLGLLIYNCDEVLNLVDNKALDILEKIYPEFSPNNKGLALQLLYKLHDDTPRALELFIRYFTDPDERDLNNMNMYEAVIAFRHTTNPEHIDILTREFSKVFPFDDFRTVAVVELFSEYVANKLIEKHPVENNLFVVRRWIEAKEDQSKFSYAISGCAALSLINTQESIDLLKLAMKHPDLEVQLESAFSQMLLKVDGANDFMIELLLNPKTSVKARNYTVELDNRYNIDLPLPSHIANKVNNDPDFNALSLMCNWLSHEREYGYPPDKIEIWDRRELFWPPTDKVEIVYLLKYIYNSFEYSEKPLEGIGYYITSSNSSVERVFSLRENFGSIEEAYAAYCRYESKEDISIKEALNLLQKHNTFLK